MGVRYNPGGGIGFIVAIIIVFAILYVAKKFTGKFKNRN